MKVMKIQKGFFAALVFCCALAFAGCEGGSAGTETETTAENYITITDEFAEIILAADSDSALYDAALLAIGAYAESQSDEDLAAARQSIEDTLAQMQEIYDSIEEYELDYLFEDMLSAEGIDSEEFLQLTKMRAVDLSGYMSGLESLDIYLVVLEEDAEGYLMDDFLFIYDIDLTLQELEREYNYISINYWFAGWNDQRVEYVKEQIHSNLTSYESSSDVWDDDRDSVETRLTVILDEMEELTFDLAEEIAESEEELYSTYYEIYGETP